MTYQLNMTDEELETLILSGCQESFCDAYRQNHPEAIKQVESVKLYLQHKIRELNNG